MKRYDSYKDSGVQWIGEIPSHWEIVRLKMLVKEHLMYGANEAAESDNKDFPRYIRITDIDDNGELKDETFKSLEPAKAKDYLLTKGDVLFARSGATVGKTYLFKEDYQACFAGYLIKATCNYRLCPSFLLRFTQSGLYNNWKNSIFIQSTIQNIGADKYNELLLTLPSFKEQEAIATYLDSKCSKIDNVIATQEKRVELLRELKQSIITRAVTRGIPSTGSGQAHAKMKDSGVEWIGEIPEHWEVQRIKHVVKQIGDVDHYMPKSVESGIPYVMTGDLQEMTSLIDFDSCKQISNQDYLALSKKIKAETDDIIFARYATIGTTCYVDIEKEFIVSYSCVTIKPNKNKISGKYLIYNIKSNAFAEEVQSYINSNTQGNVGVESLNSTRLAVPPLEEQGAIVTYIEQQTSKLDSSITKALRQIELLKEYKQSLITEVVTGKRKVIYN